MRDAQHFLHTKSWFAQTANMHVWSGGCSPAFARKLAGVTGRQFEQSDQMQLDNMLSQAATWPAPRHTSGQLTVDGWVELVAFIVVGGFVGGT